MFLQHHKSEKPLLELFGCILLSSKYNEIRLASLDISNQIWFNLSWESWATYMVPEAVLKPIGTEEAYRRIPVSQPSSTSHSSLQIANTSDEDFFLHL